MSWQILLISFSFVGYSNRIISDISDIGVVGVSGSSHWDVPSSYSRVRVVESSMSSDSGSENESVLAGVEALDESEHIVRDRGEGGR